MAELIRDVAIAEGRIERNEDGSHARRSQQRHDPLRAVRQLYRDPLTGLDAEVPKRRRQRARAAGHVVITEPPAAGHQAFAVRMRPDPLLEERR